MRDPYDDLPAGTSANSYGFGRLFNLGGNPNTRPVTFQPGFPCRWHLEIPLPNQPGMIVVMPMGTDAAEWVAPNPPVLACTLCDNTNDIPGLLLWQKFYRETGTPAPAGYELPKEGDGK